MQPLTRGAGGRWHGTVVTPDPAAWAPHPGPCDGAPADRPFLCVEGLD